MRTERNRKLRAKGGAAAVTVSELMVHPDTDGSHAYHLDESILNSLAAATYTADAIRRHGAMPSLELSHSGMFAEIDKYVTVHTGYKAVKVTEEGVVCEDAEGNEKLVPGRSVICALGQRARTDVVEALQDTAPFIRVIGDASRVSTITNAVYQGYHAALDI